ncbi:hypothetical protein BT69DRAFT_360829 [Atractiella rhizophila]|nr:hypothetical protein BT69DRAFT_360829 [Atractiella rhizophila]
MDEPDVNIGVAVAGLGNGPGAGGGSMGSMGQGLYGSVSNNPLAMSVGIDKHLLEALKLSKNCSAALIKTAAESQTLKEMNKLLKDENDRLSKGAGTSSAEFIQLITDLQARIRELERENQDQKQLLSRFTNLAKRAEAPLDPMLFGSGEDEEDIFVGAPVSANSGGNATPSSSQHHRVSAAQSIGGVSVKNVGGHGQGVGFGTPTHHGQAAAGYGMMGGWAAT